MKLLNLMICALLVLGACQPPQDNTANEAFEANSKIIMAYIEGYQSENLDYDAWYADDVLIRGTSFGAPDSLGIEDLKAQDKEFLASFDLELMTDPVLLPGVNVDTKKADGSVRYYGDWKMILQATDSTEEKSVVVKLYESFDFNEEGKIVFQQSYGDISAAYEYIMEDDDEMENDMDEEM
ncbi:hypothetical protein SAMN04488029_1314 [Reichenbachiella faecimaris]|uniref:SnoaL-like domain-containing protein n=1 Tax=Reichenbachiella faecimaris TaxID=692418 RepID=A0A1W2G8J5_REIFA|nr:hypothetical protein [Reichenbachiella faecimaris]SMD32953.1 hypothetical protein SAMN04488029_1314 [Reichenbachiella faecimaris]